MEKISDTQVKFFLNRSDLNERNINMSELAFGTEKAHALFREMMREAADQCDFDFENSPIMIEAVTLSVESLMIVVTKINSMEEFEGKLNFLPSQKERGRLKPKEIEEQKKQTRQDSDMTIYSFVKLDDAVDASLRLYGRFGGTSLLIKEQSKFFLVLHNDFLEEQLSMAELEGVLGEYGEKHISTTIAKHYLTEHGEILISCNAVQVLAQNLG